jgi:hypothetical protein
MKKYLFISSMLLACMLTLTSCEAIGAIFKAGVWSGIIVVVLVLAIVIYIISRLTKKG